MSAQPDPSAFLPVDQRTADDKTFEHNAATRELSINEKEAQPSSSPETPNVAEGEMVVVDKDGNVDYIRESDYSPDEYKKLLRKVDRFLLPLMWFCYGIQQTDKTSIGTQAIFGLIEDTNLVGQQYSWLTTIFYITYLAGEFPSNFLLQRWSIGKSLSLYMLCWGIVVMCIGACQNWSQLMALRALQGFFECTISPGFVMTIGLWYRREEHPNRSLWFQSANAGFGVIASLVNYGIGSHAEKHPTGLSPWRGISFFLGTCTIILAIICFFLLGSPKEVRWLNKHEKRMAAARVLQNKAGRDVIVKWKWSQVWEACRDPQLWFCMLNAFLSSVPNGGLTAFSSIMYASFGFSTLEVILVDIPRSVTSLVIFLCVAIYLRRVANRRMYIMAAACLPPFVGLLALSLLPNTEHYKWTKWGEWRVDILALTFANSCAGMFLMTVPYVLSLFLAWTLIQSNVAGRTKKTIISSATFLGYCVGNMCGSQIFREDDAPRYTPGTIGACACLGIEFALIVAWRLYYTWQNRRRERWAAAGGLSKEDQERLGREMGEDNKTDLQNWHFRYTM